MGWFPSTCLHAARCQYTCLVTIPQTSQIVVLCLWFTACQCYNQPSLTSAFSDWYLPSTQQVDIYQRWVGMTDVNPGWLLRSVWTHQRQSWCSTSKPYALLASHEHLWMQPLPRCKSDLLLNNKYEDLARFGIITLRSFPFHSGPVSLHKCT